MNFWAAERRPDPWRWTKEEMLRLLLLLPRMTEEAMEGSDSVATESEEMDV